MSRFTSPVSAALVAVSMALATLAWGCAETSVEGPKPAANKSVSARHILVQYKGSDRASPDITRTKEEALARIHECLKRARKGEKFEDLAIEYSDGPSAPKGGDLGSFTAGQMVPAFSDAAFACEVGEISDVVETKYGYHIIQRYE